jgi:ribosome-associated protein
VCRGSAADKIQGASWLRALPAERRVEMEKHEIQIDTPFIRLDQMLKFCGLAETGGHAKEIVEEGVCKVNGAICIQRGKKLFPGDTLQVDDILIEVTGFED